MLRPAGAYPRGETTLALDPGMMTRSATCGVARVSKRKGSRRENKNASSSSLIPMSFQSGQRADLYHTKLRLSSRNYTRHQTSPVISCGKVRHGVINQQIFPSMTPLGHVQCFWSCLEGSRNVQTCLWPASVCSFEAGAKRDVVGPLYEGVATFLQRGESAEGLTTTSPANAPLFSQRESSSKRPGGSHLQGWRSALEV